MDERAGQNCERVCGVCLWFVQQTVSFMNHIAAEVDDSMDARSDTAFWLLL